MALTPQWLDELRARTTLSTLIGKSVKVTRAGREWKACCPFHNEKTPSFTINDDKGFYHCFGCGAHGDAIRWMTDQRGLGFMDAVKELAASAGLEVPAADPASARRAEEQVSLRDVTEASAAWFRGQLVGSDGAEAREYLIKRGLSQPIIDTFGLGFAPDARGRLREVLSKFGDALAVEAGMLIQPPDDAPAHRREPYDRFRGRLMIPIRDVRGRTIAFGGRILGAGEPKYLNSPDTPLFDKGRVLFNLDRAASAARKAERLIVVEGYMDVIALAQVGIEEAVAPLGTALTEDQIALAWKQVPVPILAFDGDAAGQRAALRAAHRALPLLKPGFSLSFMILPSGQDPDDIVRSGGATAFNALAAEALPLAKLLYRTEVSSYDVTLPDGRAALKAGLTKTSELITDSGLESEYRRWFIDKFYGDFGWKKSNINEIKRASIEALKISRLTIENSIFRSILFGFVDHPQIALNNLEMLATISANDNDFDNLRGPLVDQLFSRPSTYESGFQQIRDTSIRLPRTFNKIFDLCFRWNKVTGFGDQLDRSFKLFAVDRDLELEIGRINSDLKNDPSDDKYYALQARLRACTERLGKVRSEMFSLFEASAETPNQGVDSAGPIAILA